MDIDFICFLKLIQVKKSNSINKLRIYFQSRKMSYKNANSFLNIFSYFKRKKNYIWYKEEILKICIFYEGKL